MPLYELLSRTLSASIDNLVELSCAQFIQACAAQTARNVLDELERAGLIDDGIAGRLALQLIDQFGPETEQSGKVVLRIGHTETERIYLSHLGLSEPSTPTEPPFQAMPRSDRKPHSQRTCPICGKELYSPTAIGCVKHWREVKRRQAEQADDLLTDYYDTAQED